ncbi:MAG: transporter substrate-binding domain-containing protein [Desulfobulbaceae bacterium]|nr:transporter substrate-binding domain-containing protein [Desulfobulbaceae bacterium]
MARKLTINVFLILSLFIGIAYAQDLTIITEEYPPLSFKKDGILTGSSIEVVREILRRLKQPDNIIMLPWARGYNLLKTQSNRALFSTTRTKERESLFHWVGLLCISQNGFYAKKGSTHNINSLDDAKKVGSIATYKEDAREQMLKLWGFTNLDSSNSAASNLKKLLSGRVDLWMYDSLGMPKVAEHVGVDTTELELVLPLNEVSLYVAFSKGTPEKIVKKWQKTLDNMKRDGTFEFISKKWLPINCMPKFTSGISRKKHRVALKIFTEDSPPGNYLHNEKLTGLSVEVIREILSRLNIPENIQVVPWARGYSLTLTQPNVALFSTTRLPQREKLFKWVGPLYTQTWGFYSKKGLNLQIDSLDDAKKVARIGTYYKDAKEQFLKKKGFANLVSTNKNISNIKRLIEGKLDLWVSSDFNMPYLAQQAGVAPNQLELVHTFRKVNNYIAFSIQTPDELIDTWQQTLDELKRDGTYKRLSEKYK